MSSSPTATATAPFTPAAAQNESVPTPFGLQCTPSPSRCHKPHGVPPFPTMVNNATTGIHHRSTGSGDPPVPLSLPRGVPVHCEPHRPLLLRRRRPKTPRRVSLSTAPTEWIWTAAVKAPPPHLLRFQVVAGPWEARQPIERTTHRLLRCSPSTRDTIEPKLPPQCRPVAKVSHLPCPLARLIPCSTWVL
jgi:hypothetical protein